MTGARLQRILYATAVDVGAPNGPAVNEREFLAALLGHFGDRCRALVPHASAAVPELRHPAVRWLPRTAGATGVARLQLALRRALARELAVGQWDLLVVRAGLVPFGLRPGAAAGPPLAIKTLGGAVLDGPSGWSGRLAAPLHRAALAGLVGRAAVIDACTEELATRIRGRFPECRATVAVIPNAVNTSRFCPGSASEARTALGLPPLARVLGYAGGAPAERGGLFIVEALAALADAQPDLYGLVVGGPTDAVLRRAKDLGVAHRCVMPGVVPYERVAQYVRAMDVGVALDRPERLGMVGNSHQKVRQYLACGKPVITTPGGQIPLRSLGIGDEVEPDDAQAFIAVAARWLCLGDDDRAAVARRARDYAETTLTIEAGLRARLAMWEQAVVAGASQ